MSLGTRRKRLADNNLYNGSQAGGGEESSF
jgi:hypothetical protein